MKQSAAKFYSWSIEKASSEKASFWLAFLFGLELFLFIPLDAVLMFFCLQKRSNIFLYVMIATLASTISGVVGYLFGHFLWDLIGNWVVPHLIATTTFNHLSSHLQLYENWAVFFGSLIPFPLKALSLASGVFQLGVIPFIVCLFTARLLRFSLIGATMALWGVKVKTFVDKHFHRLFMLLGAKIAIVFLFFWALAR
jgi:membrane protein YqaA with SNARE-associated domain